MRDFASIHENLIALGSTSILAQQATVLSALSLLVPSRKVSRYKLKDCTTQHIIKIGQNL